MAKLEIEYHDKIKTETENTRQFLVMLEDLRDRFTGIEEDHGVRVTITADVRENYEKTQYVEVEIQGFANPNDLEYYQITFGNFNTLKNKGGILNKDIFICYVSHSECSDINLDEFYILNKMINILTEWRWLEYSLRDFTEYLDKTKNKTQ